jgi:hypothetical protein
MFSNHNNWIVIGGVAAGICSFLLMAFAILTIS